MPWEYQDLAGGGELGAGIEIDVSEFSQEDKYYKKLVFQCAKKCFIIDEICFLVIYLINSYITEFHYDMLFNGCDD